MQRLLFVQACPGLLARTPNAIASHFIAELQVRNPGIMVDAVDLRSAMRAPAPSGREPQPVRDRESPPRTATYVLVVPDLEEESASRLGCWLGMPAHGDGRRPLAGSTAVVVPGKTSPAVPATVRGAADGGDQDAGDAGADEAPPVMSRLRELGVEDCRCLAVAPAPSFALSARELARIFHVPDDREQAS